MLDTIKKVTVMGAGIMGNQIAIQAAMHGYQVACYDISEDMIPSPSSCFLHFRCV